jgi:hypothetical protein
MIGRAINSISENKNPRNGYIEILSLVISEPKLQMRRKVIKGL